jgi:hypothetical protein
MLGPIARLNSPTSTLIVWPRGLFIPLSHLAMFRANNSPRTGAEPQRFVQIVGF